VEYEIDAMKLPGIQIGLYELLRNAIVHGNLGISHAEQEEALERGSTGLTELIAERSAIEERGGRKVVVEVTHTTHGYEWTISDEGEGFDYMKFMETSRHEFPSRDALDAQGRGVLLTRLKFDKMEYVGRGNQVRVAIFDRD
jgi:anti-sigma regulatory factor (Ser/Thr protein kinase)